jgi:hypothetical protein
LPPPPSTAASAAKPTNHTQHSTQSSHRTTKTTTTATAQERHRQHPRTSSASSHPAKQTSMDFYHDHESEERCFLCGLGGDLIVCEFPRCTKVYHQLCLGAYPFPLDRTTEWLCPRHSCVLSGKKEDRTAPKAMNTMWHCLQCPVAIDESAWPQVRHHRSIV